MGDTGFYRCRLEFGLFGRLNGTVEFFRKASRDLLFNVSQPLSSGSRKDRTKTLVKFVTKGWKST